MACILTCLIWALIIYHFLYFHFIILPCEWHYGFFLLFLLLLIMRQRLKYVRMLKIALISRKLVLPNACGAAFYFNRMIIKVFDIHEWHFTLPLFSLDCVKFLRNSKKRGELCFWERFTLKVHPLTFKKGKKKLCVQKPLKNSHFLSLFLK